MKGPPSVGRLWEGRFWAPSVPDFEGRKWGAQGGLLGKAGGRVPESAARGPGSRSRGAPLVLFGFPAQRKGRLPPFLPGVVRSTELLPAWGGLSVWGLARLVPRTLHVDPRLPICPL